MAVEFSAFTGIIAPDEKVIDYLLGKTYSPIGQRWQQACEYWRQLNTDSDAVFDREITIDCADIVATVTWGTSPEHAAPINSRVPDPSQVKDDDQRAAMTRALQYQGLQPGQLLSEVPIDAAFIGSCTNSRLSDLRSAAQLLAGKKIASHVKAIVVPGSRRVKRAAEAEGLDKLFTDAGFEWRDSGCSMCFYAGGETFGAGKRVISSTNRNFENRQGPGTRTHLASPSTVAASALTGKITDPAEIASSTFVEQRCKGLAS
jgi:3-isopropylmalate/(R)-2-methylmalate dehydratase large subunit